VTWSMTRNEIFAALQPTRFLFMPLRRCSTILLLIGKSNSNEQYTQKGFHFDFSRFSYDLRNLTAMIVLWWWINLKSRNSIGKWIVSLIFLILPWSSSNFSHVG
jgi:hypothetical protein